MSRVMVDRSLASFQRNAAKSVAMLKELSNDKRLMILCKLLEHGEMSVMKLSAEVGLSQSALSQHLARMRKQKIIGFRREAQQLFYRVTDTRVRQILLTLKDIYC
jgi:DNA-binding transcriptional ArsR family regulator